MLPLFSKMYQYICPKKFNIDTKNNGMENVYPFNYGVILDIYVKFYEGNSAKQTA